jgi:hypothetical protein
VRRGRKSSDALALVPHIVPVVPRQRPDPPKELTEPEKREWTAYVDHMPPTWFTREMHPMLADLTRAVCLSRRYKRRLDEASVAVELLDKQRMTVELRAQADAALEREERYAKLWLEQSKHAKTLATALRLTPQARYQPNTAGTRTRDPESYAAVKQLWET